MQIKFLKSIVENLINKQAVPIIDLLIEKKDLNEFIIAKKLELTINQTRNILYKLSDYGLVSFVRKKDKRKGWYIYFWTLNVYQSLNLLEQKLNEELKQLEIQLKSRNEKRYFFCNTCSIEVTEEAALLNDFTCPECEETYALADNQEVIKKLEREIQRVKKEIELVFIERKKEEEKLEKKKTKKIHKAEEEKKKIRREAMATRKKEKEKMKKPVKKIINKKISKKKPYKSSKKKQPKKLIKKKPSKSVKKKK